MPTTRQRRPTRAETRQRVLEAAERVFAARGLHAATVEEIAEEAGFSIGAIYSNFGGKEDLFLALFRQHTEQRIADVEAVDEAGSSTSARAKRASARFNAFTTDEPDWPLLFYELWAYAARNPAVRSEWNAGRRQLREAIARGLEQNARERGVELPAPAEHLAIAVNALVNGIAVERVTDPDAVPADLVEVVLGLFLRAIDGNREPAD